MFMPSFQSPEPMSGRPCSPKLIPLTRARPHAPTRRRMPPMLDISLMELTGSTEEEVLAHEARLGVDKRHHVLQLIAETEGTPWLGGSIPGPKTARHSLVQEIG